MTHVDNLGSAVHALREHDVKDVPLPEKAGGMELAQLAAQYSDGVIFGSAGVDPALRKFVETLGKPVLPFDEKALADGSYMDQYNAFYDQLL